MCTIMLITFWCVISFCYAYFKNYTKIMLLLPYKIFMNIVLVSITILFYHNFNLAKYICNKINNDVITILCRSVYDILVRSVK